MSSGGLKRAGQGHVAFKLDLDQLIYFTYCWSKNLLAKDCNEESGGMSPDTQVDWSNFHRDICAQSLLEEPTVIGGPTKIVEIDETLLAKAKYNRGRWPEQRWVFGGVERESGKCFMVEVPDRSRETLEPIIKQYIRPGTRIMSDGWAAYRQISSIEGANYSHSVIIHEKNFVLPEDSKVHTQQIEGC
eukprot:snap_masked-scaffold105_size367834-processed-gene-1.11 protein:Tk10183 transcript:snap_masked-scaffold105_size367834-processed-gene-1.11-mRNA-1 annotation:"hypothetical protein CLF_100748"